MTRFIISLTSLLLCTFCLAQESTCEILKLIEINNSSLKALRQKAEAEKIENLTGISLEDPSVGFNYLFGSPSEIGKRIDISVSQSFDFATISGLKKKEAGARNNMVSWQYKADRMNVLLRARKCCIELIYHNAMLSEMEKRLDNSSSLVKAWQSRLEKGDANRLELNNVLLSHRSLEAEIAALYSERAALLSELKGLNGGEEIAFCEKSFGTMPLLPDFDLWFEGAAEKNPVLSYLKEEIELSKRQLSLSKAAALPSLSVGYMSEKVAGEHFQGLSFGLNIPLWSNSRRIRHAKAAVSAAQAAADDALLNFYSNLESLYKKTTGLGETANAYSSVLSETDNTELLSKALSLGEISVTEYLLSISLYYDTIDSGLAASRDFFLSLADLQAVEL